ncbi:MAG TPA: hypothetical protein VH601_25470 [Bryobacteraceae bacterium]
MNTNTGPRGWVGLRLDRGEVDWDEVSPALRRHSILRRLRNFSPTVIEAPL